MFEATLSATTTFTLVMPLSLIILGYIVIWGGEQDPVLQKFMKLGSSLSSDFLQLIILAITPSGSVRPVSKIGPIDYLIYTNWSVKAGSKYGGAL